MSRKLSFLFVCASLVCALPILAQKRPLGPSDYDSWRHIQNQQLSPDGHYLAYAVFPQVGDGEIVVKDLKTGRESRQPAGELPPPPPANNTDPNVEEGPPPPPGVTIKFSPDNQEVVFLGFAPHDDVEKAKRDKRRPEDMPKGDLVIMHLEPGTAERISQVVSFQLGTKDPAYLAYLQTPATAATAKPATSAGASEPTPIGESRGRARRPVSGDLILRSAKDKTEKKFADVTEYILKNDGSLAVFAVQAKGAAPSGIFSVQPGAAGAPKAVLSGKGRYEKLVADEGQDAVAFLSSHDDPESRQPSFKLYRWDEKTPVATEVVSNQTSGFPADWIIAERANVVVAPGGNQIFFGTAPKPHPVAANDNTPADEKLLMDLWSWKDDHIQPMQKVRAAAERARSYRAVFNVSSSKFLQLADPTMQDLTPSKNGHYALGGDDRDYRKLPEYDERAEDAYIVNTETGERKLVAKKHPGRVTWAPDGQHAIYFDGKDWMLISAANGSVHNVTEKSDVAFSRAYHDSPGRAPAEAPAVWSSDGKYVLLADNFDLWRVTTADGSAINLTKAEGRKNQIAFRIVRSERGGADTGVDVSKPILMRAENQVTRDSGFYQANIDANSAPTKLVMSAKNFAPAIKAKNADVYVTAISTFSQYPDLLVTDGSFRELKKVTDLGSQMNKFTWGTTELVKFRSVDGVPLQGTLYKPENFDPNKKYPLLVYIYERLTQNLNLFVEPKPMDSINVSLYVSNGYVVLEPDIAYKVGYPGQSGLNCVLPAIQEVVNKGYIDENAIGIQGHSWGGYQVAYMVTRTNRFRAAEAGAPVANMISAYDGIRWGPGLPRQFQYEKTQSRIGGTIWDYPLRFIENSPIFMADRITTPLLMIHNDADDAVPWYQGIEYYLALRRLNKEVYMFSYNGEPHHVRKRVNQKDYAIRMKGYFDYFLKGEAKPEWMEKGIPYIERAQPTAQAASVSEDEEPLDY